jgi:RND family efflux transporter MFP subunit
MRGLAGVLTIVALCGGIGCSGADEPRPDGTHAASKAPTNRVETKIAELGTVQSTIIASGSIEACRITAIGPEVQGRLVEVFVDVGDEVEAGDPLFQIDPRPYEMALEEARAGLELAEAESANARNEAARSRKLVKQQIVAPQHHAQLRTQAAVARARVEQMKARLARAEHDLERTLVGAPYRGSIVERRAHEGAMASGEPIVVLQESHALEAVLGIPESAPAVVRPGDAVRLFVEGRARPLEATVSRVSDRIDPESRTYLIRVPVSDPSRSVKAGSYVSAEVAPSPGPPRPLVPLSALLRRDGRSYVFRVVGKQADRVLVRVGRQNREQAEILAGIEAGEVIVIGDLVRRLTHGDHVAIAGALPAVSSARQSGEATP